MLLIFIDSKISLISAKLANYQYCDNFLIHCFRTKDFKNKKKHWSQIVNGLTDENTEPSIKRRKVDKSDSAEDSNSANGSGGATVLCSELRVYDKNIK
jgi:hypothetical protein